MLLVIGFGAAAFGKYFRRYSAGTILTFVIFGALTFMGAPKLAAGLPTPWLGVWERVNILAYMLWAAVFAARLLRPRPFVRSLQESTHTNRAGEPDDFAAAEHVHANTVTGF
jgi:hypothetical protein